MKSILKDGNTMTEWFIDKDQRVKILAYPGHEILWEGDVLTLAYVVQEYQKEFGSLRASFIAPMHGFIGGL